jgi:thioredoxin 1
MLINYKILIILSYTALACSAVKVQEAYKEINSLNEFQQAINSNKPTVLFFYAPWCGSSTAMKPLFAQSAQSYKDKANFIALDVTKEHLKDPVDMFGIQGIPTLFYKEVGIQSKEQFTKRLTAILGPLKAAAKPTPKVTPKKIIKKPAPKKNIPAKSIAKKPIVKKNT